MINMAGRGDNEMSGYHIFFWNHERHEEHEALQDEAFDPIF
jgi:hypothetical protein